MFQIMKIVSETLSLIYLRAKKSIYNNIKGKFSSPFQTQHNTMEGIWTPLIFTQQISIENLGQALCQKMD